MKPLFLLFLLLITFTGYAQSGKWEKMNTDIPKTFGYGFYCVSCCDSKNCIAIGYVNEFYGIDSPDNRTSDMFQRTTDGGETWIRAKEQDSSFPQNRTNSTLPYLRKIKMLDSLHAVAVGDSGRIVTTSDGGTTWLQRDSKTTWTLNDVAFYDSLNGMAVGYNWTYRITSDGGVTWQERPPFTNEAVLKDVEALAPHTYYIIDRAYTKLFRTFNDGVTWDSTFIFKSNLLNSKDDIKFINAAAFSDTLNGWVAGVNYSLDDTMSPFIARTKTGGLTWKVVYFSDNTQPHDPRFGVYTVTDLFSSSPKSCIAVGRVSAVLQTNDGGETWIREPFADTSRQELPLSLSVASNNLAFLAGQNGSLFRRQYPSTGVSETISEGKNNQYFYITTLPVPATSLMQVSLYGLYSVKNEILTVKVYNMLGVEVADYSAQANSGNNGSYSTFNADVSKLGGGVYVLQYSAGGYTKSGLFVVAR